MASTSLEEAGSATSSTSTPTESAYPSSPTSTAVQSRISLAAPYLSIPSTSSDSPAVVEAPVRPSIRKDRIYIGNLHPSVDEYTLLQIFGKYGRIAHLDFLFHKTGPLKGKPRGYAFMEYVEKEDALNAIVELNNKPLRGRRIAVTFSHQAPVDSSGSSSPKSRPRIDTSRPTTLSLLKNSSSRSRGGGTEDKIQAMERKLAQLAKDPSIAPAQTTVIPQEAGLPDRPSASLVRAAEVASDFAAQNDSEIGPSRLSPQKHTQQVQTSSPSPSTPTPPMTSRISSTVTRAGNATPKSKPKALAGVKLGPRR